MKHQRYRERTDSNVQWRGNLPLNSESVLESSLPGKQVRQQRPVNDRDPVQSENEFLLTSLSRGKRNRLQINIADFEFLKTKQQKPKRNWKEAPFWQSNPKRTAIRMKKLLKTNCNRSTEYYKIQHSWVRIDQTNVSNVKTKKTTSFERKKDQRWADELGRETSQHLTWCRSAVRQKVSIHKNDGKLMKVF